MPLQNPLDVLFRDIKRDQREAELRQMRIPLPPKPPTQSTYANPQNWKVGRAIEIIHSSEGSVGIFLEYFHRLSPTARRLLPAPQGTVPVTSELVFGEWWLHPRNQAPAAPADSEAEIQAIIRRFNELLQEFDDEDEVI
jgi:hypothetical protein